MNIRHLAFAIVIAAIATACGNNKASTDAMTPEQAIEVLTAKIHKNDNDADLYFQRATMFMQVERSNDAIVDLLHAIKLDDDNTKYLLLLADAYFKNGNVEESYSTLGRVLEIDPDSQEAILKQGEVAYYSRDYDRALESLSRVTESDPNNRQALFMKSFIYKEKGDTVSAVQLLRKVCDIYPDFAGAYEELGVLYADHHDPMAIDYLTTAIRLDSLNPTPRYCLASFYQETENYTLAVATYRQLLAIAPTHTDALHNLGYISLFYYDDYDSAIDYFNRTLQADSTYVAALVNRGITYELLDQRDKAIDDFTHALELSPTYQPAIDGLQRTKR